MNPGGLRFIDIGANLNDAVFDGVYRGKRKHACDIASVLARARAHGVQRTIVTVGRACDVAGASALCGAHDCLWHTVGVHPTRARDAGGDAASLSAHIGQLRACMLASGGRLVAVGECGLDYDRLEFASKAEQLPVFEAQFALAEESGKPMFFHNRGTDGDFARVVRGNRGRFGEGVVHSFTGDVEEMRELVGMGLYIGVNGCSLKTEGNLRVVREIPVERLMLETDAPYCEIRPTHAGYKFVSQTVGKVDLSKKNKVYDAEMLVKGRCEPAQIRQVCEVVASVKGMSESEVAEAAYANTMRVFFPTEG